MNLFQPLLGIERVRRSRPAALPSNQPKGFPVALKPLRVPSRRVVVITSGTNGRAMRAPTGDGLLPPLRRSPSLEEGGLGVSPVKACGLAVDWI